MGKEEEFEFNVDDRVVGIFNKLEYVVLKVKRSPSVLEELKGDPHKDLFCLCSNGNRGWLRSGEVKLVKK